MFNSPYSPYLYGNNPIYNPNLTPMQRMEQINQQYTPPMNSQQAQQQNTQPQTFYTIPVSNVEEANAFRVDIGGIPTFFYNAGKKEVYLKRTNPQTGSADFFTFSLQEAPSEVQKETIAAPVTYEKDFKALNDKIDGLYSLFSNIQRPLVQEVYTEPEPAQPVKGGRNAK